TSAPPSPEARTPRRPAPRSRGSSTPNPAGNATTRTGPQADQIFETGVRELHAEVLVVGGGLGGVAAAIAACQLGRWVVLTEKTNWVGGQLTAQAVPPDEHPWIEQFGCLR